MRRPHRQPHGRATRPSTGFPHRFRSAVLVMPIFLAGCFGSEQTQPSCQEVPTSHVVGQVITEGGLFTTCEATLSSLIRDYRVAHEVGGDGRYAFVVPPGDYSLALSLHGDARYVYSSNGAAHGYQSDPDTLRVSDGDTLRADFQLGSLLLEVSVPAELRGTSLWVTAHGGADGGRTRWTAHSRVEWTENLAWFRLPALAPGMYAFEMAALGPTGDLEVWLPASHSPEGAESVLVVAGQFIRHPFQTPASLARLCGEIVGSWQAMGIAPPEVALLDADSTVVSWLGPDGADGSFCVPFIVPDSVRVHVDIQGSERWVGGTSFATATVFALASGSVTSIGRIEESGLLLELKEPGPRILGDFAIELVKPGEASPVRTLRIRDFSRFESHPFPESGSRHVLRACLESETRVGLGLAVASTVLRRWRERRRSRFRVVVRSHRLRCFWSRAAPSTAAC